MKNKAINPEKGKMKNKVLMPERKPRGNPNLGYLAAYIRKPCITCGLMANIMRARGECYECSKKTKGAIEEMLKKL